MAPAAWADGISPVLNLFHKDMWLPATIVTVAIIIVETVLLRVYIKQLSYLQILWRCTALNIASSITGSVLLLGLGRNYYFVWDTMSLVLPLFIITLLTEIPLLRLLCKKIALSWKSAIGLGIGINLVSYIAVFIIEFALVVGYIWVADYRDKQDKASWVHPEILKKVTGQIYATESGRDGERGLRRLDMSTGHWLSLTNCPTGDLMEWDIEGNLCAYVLYTSGTQGSKAFIASLPDFSILREIDVNSIDIAQYNQHAKYRRLADLALSPDARKLALLVRIADAVAYKDKSSYFDLNGKCVLVVFDVNTGQPVARASRWASDCRLCWLPDSSGVVFISFKDESIFNANKEDVRGTVGYGIGYSRDKRFQSGSYSFNLQTGEIRWFCDGVATAVSAGSRQIVVMNDDKACLLDPQGNSRIIHGVSRLNYAGLSLSPCGRFLLAGISRHQPLNSSGRLTLIDLSDPTQRHIITDDFDDAVWRNTFKWIDTNAAAFEQPNGK